MNETAGDSDRIAPPLIAGAVVAAALLTAMYWHVGAYFGQRWINEDTYHHCLFVPAVVVWLIWRRRESLAEITPTPSWRGLILIGAGALLYVLAMRTGVRVAIGFSFPIIILGLAWTALGGRYTRAIGYPLVLLFFLIPVPKHILGHFGMPMQIWSAEGAARVATFLGLPVVHEGINLTLNGHTYVVAEACSGLNSMLALFLAAAVLVDILSVRWTARLVLLAIPVIVLAANTVRLTSVLFFAEFAGPEFAMDSLVHGGSDVIIYLVALMFTWALIDLFSERRLIAIVMHRDEPPDVHDPDEPNAPAASDENAARPRAGEGVAECGDIGAAELSSMGD